MKRKVNGKVREVSEGRVVMELSMPMAEVLTGLPEMVESLSRDAGMLLIQAVMQSECERMAGRKHTRNPNRGAYWWGEEEGSVCYDQRKVPVLRPRMRSTDGKREIPLETYTAMRSDKGMRSAIARGVILGLSNQGYEESVGQFLKGYGIKRSSVSRHFVQATGQQMREFMERDLSALDLCAIFIDGIEFKGHLLVVALGLDKDGRKHILGLREGATENREVCVSLLEDMVRRGLDASRDYLFVLDGSKALRSAVTRVFGEKAHVQRCQQHKRRNVREHLPVEHQEHIDARIRSAYNMASHEDAKRSLELVVKHLEMLNPSAAASLREGLEETLTVHRLGVPPLLRKTLSTTNPIESCFSVTRAVTGRVKRWRGGDMVQRWAVAALLRAEGRFIRVRGYKDIPRLMAALALKNLDSAQRAA
jgi:transposase-like protein